jgi:hypothetical protein
MQFYRTLTALLTAARNGGVREGDHMYVPGQMLLAADRHDHVALLVAVAKAKAKIHAVPKLSVASVLSDDEVRGGFGPAV